MYSVHEFSKQPLARKSSLRTSGQGTCTVFKAFNSSTCQSTKMNSIFAIESSIGKEQSYRLIEIVRTSPRCAMHSGKFVK